MYYIHTPKDTDGDWVVERVVKRLSDYKPKYDDVMYYVRKSKKATECKVYRNEDGKLKIVPYLVLQLNLQAAMDYAIRMNGRTTDGY